MQTVTHVSSALLGIRRSGLTGVRSKVKRLVALHLATSLLLGPRLNIHQSCMLKALLLANRDLTINL